MNVKSESEVAQSCPTLCNLMDSSLPSSSVRGILQARALEWGAIAFSDERPQEDPNVREGSRGKKGEHLDQGGCRDEGGVGLLLAYSRVENAHLARQHLSGVGKHGLQTPARPQMIQMCRREAARPPHNSHFQRGPGSPFSQLCDILGRQSPGREAEVRRAEKAHSTITDDTASMCSI